jgi:hypothetical protein
MRLNKKKILKNLDIFIIGHLALLPICLLSIALDKVLFLIDKYANFISSFLIGKIR